ncbi:glycosyltransferase family 4 protein [Chryseobacterium sp. PBS4-4]|uniref:Glycosyltransferase family 4 protein n=1 Tax=Chryseobacterium edaphi TaxID=2976532 RepID=A0ABT2WB61_9FLAO|nr:glycosyltransferase family 1 protein [Chryseobacterium edaphi]MCU7618679.1 glycosyltransferase family 4 protein [Chryseobacterium edaphi]
MKIFINARFLTQSITGVQRFAIELSKRLRTQSSIDVEFLSPKDIIHEDLAEELGAKRIGHFKGHLWEQIDLPLYLKQNKNPLLLSLCSTAPVFYKNQIVTHHDITYIRYPESFSKKFVGLYKIIIPLMLKNSKKIITVSEFSKSEISNYFKIPKEKFVVIYNGVDQEKFKFSALKDSLATDYILAVSSRNFHKNFQGLIDSFNKIKDNIKNVNLYIVGGSEIKSFNNIELDIESLKQKNRVDFLGRVDDDELVKLYQNAALFVFPSFYEGFGIPPLEAQACGCPVIASEKASMPEVLGDSVLYFDPFSETQLSEKILFFFDNLDVKNQLVEKGLENIKKFNWDNSVKILVENIRFNIS